MSVGTVEDHAEQHGVELSPEQQVKANRFGLWLFFISEIFLFTALLVARFFLWGNTRPELNQVVGLIATSILLISSFFVYRGETAIEHGDKKRFMSNFLWAALFGTLFFIGVVVLEWNIFGLSGEIAGIEIFGTLQPTDGVFGGVFFAMTGIHALHVLSGIFLLLAAWYNGRKNKYSATDNWGVEGTALYWHYVDVVWVFFYPALYLIGTAV